MTIDREERVEEMPMQSSVINSSIRSCMYSRSLSPVRSSQIRARIHDSKTIYNNTIPTPVPSASMKKPHAHLTALAPLGCCFAWSATPLIVAVQLAPQT